jgi:hypothetical protein
MSSWKLVRTSDLPVPTAAELAQLRAEWVNQPVSFFDGKAWRPGRFCSDTCRKRAYKKRHLQVTKLSEGDEILYS